MSVYSVLSDKLSISRISELMATGSKLELSDEARVKINTCRNYLDEKMKSNSVPIYGINTGFGALHNTAIKNENLEQLQKNLVMSHACGIGDTVPKQVVKLMLLLKVQGLSYGHSGAQEITVQRLIDFYNSNVLPVVYQLGSLGASGDLAPLAHLTLPIIGLGEVWNGEAIEQGSGLDFEPITLKSKEGLALLNGTQFMSAYGVTCLMKLKRLSKLADLIAAVSLDAYDGRIEPFNENVHRVRNHTGQLQTAKAIRNHLSGSEIAQVEKAHVQDPYSFRCVPQVHGASKDVIAFVTTVFETEINSVTDNPTIFPDEDQIVSAGNFHGQPLAMALDQLAIATAELGSISERRTYKLLSGNRGLPPFLVANPGLNSGFMIPQYAAASIVSQNKQLCTPASIDTIDSSNGQEDHVSMGANAATKCYRVVENLERLLAIELYCAAQALEFRKPIKSSPVIEEFIASYRKEVVFVTNDVVHHDNLRATENFIKTTEIPQ